MYLWEALLPLAAVVCETTIMYVRSSDSTPSCDSVIHEHVCHHLVLHRAQVNSASTRLARFSWSLSWPTADSTRPGAKDDSQRVASHSGGRCGVATHGRRVSSRPSEALEARAQPNRVSWPAPAASTDTLCESSVAFFDFGCGCRLVDVLWEETVLNTISILLSLSREGKKAVDHLQAV